MTVSRLVHHEPRPAPVWELYHEASKLRRYDRAFLLSVGRVTRRLPHLSTVAFRAYPMLKSVSFAAVADSPLVAFMRRRRSQSGWGAGPISHSSVARMLRGSAGRSGPDSFHRAAPSGGALYPIEMYVVPLSVEALACGLYHYNPVADALECLWEDGGLGTKIAEATAYPQIVGQCGLVVLLTAIFERTTIKYGERGYRFALLEAGHIAQNFCLLAQDEGLGARCLGGFYDREVESLLHVNGVDESALYMIAAGPRPNGGENHG